MAALYAFYMDENVPPELSDAIRELSPSEMKPKWFALCFIMKMVDS